MPGVQNVPALAGGVCCQLFHKGQGIGGNQLFLIVRFQKYFGTEHIVGGTAENKHGFRGTRDPQGVLRSFHGPVGDHGQPGGRRGPCVQRQLYRGYLCQPLKHAVYLHQR